MFNLKPEIDSGGSWTKHLDILLLAFNFKHNSLGYTVSSTLSISLNLSDGNHLFTDQILSKNEYQRFQIKPFEFILKWLGDWQLIVEA